MGNEQGQHPDNGDANPPDENILTSNEEIDAYLGVEDEDEGDDEAPLSARIPDEPAALIITKGKEIVKQDAPSHHAYFIKSGRAEVIIEEGGHRLVVAEISPGEVFGEIGVLEAEGRSASVRAVEKCVVVPLSKKEMQQRIDNVEDTVVRSLIDVLIKRLREANHNQFTHYKKLTEFQDRMMGLMDAAAERVSRDKREAFTKEVMPLLDRLEQLLKKYRE